MLKPLLPLVFLSLLSMTSAAGAKTLDEYMSPDQLARELLLPRTQTSPQRPFTPAQILKSTGIDVYNEFPIVIVVTKSSQSAMVYVEGRAVHNFAVSTGREKWERPKSGEKYFSETPNGWYAPQQYVRSHWSKQWDALMEYAIFFNGGIAIHATTVDHFKELGTKASGGCVRAHPSDAQWFWQTSLSRKTANVPYFTRGGQLVVNRDGSIKRHDASGTLFVIID